jgi:AcrR family transcriptional regulator
MGSKHAVPAESQRERILLATAELWSQRGYERLSIESISARAGIEVEEFEASFADPEAAAAAAIEVPLATVVSVVADLYAPDRSEAESYARAIVGILETMAANPAYTYLAYIAGRQMAPPRVRRIYEAGHQFLVAMLERLWANSTLSEQPARAGLAALGASEAVVRREILAGRYERLPALAPTFVYGAITPFLGQKEGLRLARASRAMIEGYER